jgi:hypothetical protein
MAVGLYARGAVDASRLQLLFLLSLGASPLGLGKRGSDFWKPRNMLST